MAWRSCRIVDRRKIGGPSARPSLTRRVNIVAAQNVEHRVSCEGGKSFCHQPLAKNPLKLQGFSKLEQGVLAVAATTSLNFLKSEQKETNFSMSRASVHRQEKASCEFSIAALFPDSNNQTLSFFLFCRNNLTEI